jgi:tartrate-resistant acid phosphatase type 5
MPEFHAEPYIYLPAVTHSSALVAWGAFYFKVTSRGRMKLVRPQDLEHVHPPRKDTIGARSAPYGPARVTVRDNAGAVVATAVTEVANHCWITGLSPGQTYTYSLNVNGEEWARDERWDWSPGANALVQAGGRYDNRFRTYPDPDGSRGPGTPGSNDAALTFAVIGDFGVGMKRESAVHRQQQIGDALRRAVDEHDVQVLLTTGDNIYASQRILGIPIGGSGEDDDDWFFTYFQPYRYVINRIAVYPSIGNHDTGETEDHDDRGQVEDNFYIRERMAAEEARGRASFEPGLFYRFRYGSRIEFVCIDTSKEQLFAKRLFEYPKHREFLESAFPAEATEGLWRIPFCHHPPFSAGPRHHNTAAMASLLPLFQRSGVRVMFSGHEHNFQHSETGGAHYFVSGAAGKLRRSVPNGFEEAFTRSWSSACHFLLVRIAGREMTVRAIGELGDTPGLVDVERFDRHLEPAAESMVIRL